MTTGAPMNAQTVFRGNAYSLNGNLAIKSQRTAKHPPKISAAGNTVRWLGVEKRIRAKCGAASPINAIGPQKAVMTPTIIPAAITKVS